MNEISRKYTLMIDVDGTLAQYDEFGKPIGEPLPGAVASMKRLIKHYLITIFTTRPEVEVREWCGKHEIPFDNYVQKPLNFLIIDDRALTFEGDWKDMRRKIGAFKPWNKRLDTSMPPPANNPNPDALANLFGGCDRCFKNGTINCPDHRNETQEQWRKRCGQ